ncbi:MAG: Molybdopterin-guanine dinucleotide biosynthesis protein [Gemmatimonadetes bacterium]|nr:Molybdopterin-guanine dinucleotide biosynthesis protein [Gemmatimonadota bacterium]
MADAPRRCIGAVLAGGRASRMGGAPKGLATVGGTRIVDRVMAALRAVTDEVIIVAAQPDAGEWCPGTPVVSDRVPNLGPLGGIDAALASGADVLVVAWDMPFVTPALLAALRERGERAHADAVVPEGEGAHGLEPLCAWYAASTAQFFAEAIASGDSALHRTLRTLPRLVIVERDALRSFGNPAQLLTSVNTHASLARAQKLARGGPTAGLTDRSPRPPS